MEKKKTIVLTMIGLATLMLLVIGSAFAYFSITNNSGGKTETNFTGETDQLAKYGTPTITGESNLYLDLLVTDMAQGKIGTSYWATDTKENRFEPERTDHIVSTAGISGSTTEEEAYLNCTSDLTITASVKKSGEEEPLEEDIITDGDGRVYLGYQSDKASNKVTINPNEIDLATIISATKSNKGYKTTVNYTIVGDSSVNITAAIELKNTKDDQTALAGKDIDINITNENLVCSVGEQEKMVYMKNVNDILFTDNGGMGGSKCPYENIYFVENIPERESIENIGTIDFVDISDTEFGTPANSVVAWSVKKDYQVIKFNYGVGESVDNVDAEDLYIGSKSPIYSKNLSHFFGNMYNLKTINNIKLLNTSETTDMSSMFSGSANLLNLDLSTFDTSKVTDMSHMFSRGDSAGDNLKNAITFPEGFGAAATDMRGMFSEYQGTTLDLSTFDTSQVTDMSSMFYGTSIDLPFKDWSKFTTSNVENMSSMFYDYQGTTLDLSTFDTSQVTDMSSMFYSCTKLSNLDLSSFTFDKVNSQSSTFYNVPSSCVVKIKSSQQEIFENKFTESNSYRTFTPDYVD